MGEKGRKHVFYIRRLFLKLYFQIFYVIWTVNSRILFINHIYQILTE